METEVRILKYHLKYKADFIHLNYEWLNAYFEIEPYDRQVLEDCENHILAKGGHIFFALYNGQVVGTFAYLKHEEGVYELSKMAVEKSLRGQGLGNQLMAFSIRFAEQHHWKKLILYSNRILENSIHLYRKFGYNEVPLESNSPYQRGNIKMELMLKE
jgi:GNAT superfamily N-acetyltransferase